MLIYTDGVFNGGEPETDDLDVIKSVIKGYIDKYAASKRIEIAGPPSPEYAAWSIKVAEAQAGTGPVLEAEALARGIPTAVLVAKVLGNAQAYQMAEAFIAGTAGKHKDIVSALTTREELVEYDWRFEV